MYDECLFCTRPSGCISMQRPAEPVSVSKSIYRSPAFPFSSASPPSSQAARMFCHHWAVCVFVQSHESVLERTTANFRVC